MQRATAASLGGESIKKKKGEKKHAIVPPHWIRCFIAVFQMTHFYSKTLECALST